MAEESPEEVFQLPGVWVGAEEVPVKAANQFIGQVVAADEIVLTFGHFVPPALLGTVEQRMEQVKQLTFIPIQAIARLAMTRARLEEFRGVIDQTLENHDKMAGLNP
ncbi:MAG TPA: hypothetical protein VIM33_08755 [Gaiellaceae bacterium]|jgi:hypothetical protein